MIEVVETEKGKEQRKGLNIFTSFDTVAATAVESLLLTPIHDAATRATHVISSAGEVLSHTGEFILSPLKEASSPNRWKNVSFGDGEEEKKQDDDNYSVSSFPTDTPIDIEVQPEVDIQPLFDGSGIELIANDYEDDDGKIERLNKSGSYLRGSLLMFDPVESEAENGEMEPMNLKILRGKNIPPMYNKIRIGVLNREGGEMDQIIGCTPPTEGNTDPIWGSWSCSWTIKANSATKFLFTLLAENESTADESKTICARVSTSDLLTTPNPNFWIELKDNENPIDAETYGRIQIRLTRPTDAKLHDQENCLTISPGPGIPRVQSYTLRKMVLYSCSPVMLNVYDVSNSYKIQTINNTTKSMGYGGIFHAAIEIFGKEYSFGGTTDRTSNNTGVFQCAPKKCPMHHYRESVFLGDCELNPQQVQSILNSLRPNWLAKSYNLFRKNCAFFSREFSIELGVGDIPDWVFSLASSAENIEPYLYKLDAYLKNRTKKTNTVKNITKRLSLKKSKKKTCTVIEVDESIEAHEVAKNTQEALLDHAMAARIQRGFRASSRRINSHRKRRPSIVGVASA